MTAFVHRALGTICSVTAAIIATAAGAHLALAQSTPIRMLVPDLTISGEQNDITSAPRIAVAPNGNVIVFGQYEYRGKVFDANGRLIRNFARAGQGPGEIAKVVPREYGLVDDTVWVMDNGRIALFTSDGRHIRDVRLLPRRDTSWHAGHPEYVGTSTGLTTQRLLPGGVALATTGTDGRFTKPTTTPPLLRTTWEGTVTGTPVKLPLETRFFVIPNVRTFQQVFAHTGKYALSTDGRRVVIARVRDGTRPYVELLHLATTGDTIATHRVLFTPEPINRRSVDSVIAALIAPSQGGRGNPLASPRPSIAQHERTIRDSLEVPRYHSPFSDVLVANDGTAWLRWRAPGNDRRWLLISPRGEILMQVEQPERSAILAVDGAIWGAAVDSVGFVSLIRFAVHEGR